MATAPLIPNAGSMEELLTQLEPNIQPTEPSAWPFALGYWLIFLSCIALVAFLILMYIKQKPWRDAKKEIDRIKQIDGSLTQLQDAHQLIRWLLNHYLNLPLGMTDTELSKTIQEISISPEWLNKHYNAEPSEPLVISELHTIVSDIFKETKK